MIFAGDCYFNRFCNDCTDPEVFFMRQYECEQFLNREADSEKWSYEVKLFVEEFANSLVKDRSHLFVMESQHFETNSVPPRNINIVVSVLHVSLCSISFKWMLEEIE